MSTIDKDRIDEDQKAGLESEFEHEPVPASRRKSTMSVAAVWFGFPMIITCAIFGGVLTAMLGFQQALVAIIAGNLILMLYVGALSYFSGETGLNFALVSARVFGRLGYIIPSAFLATVVIGWFAFQTGLTGLTVHQSYGWDEHVSTLVAGVIFIAVTFIGIRALAWLGMVAAPMFVVLSLVALWVIHSRSGLGGVWGYEGVVEGAGAMSLGAGITLVVATFADAGTMTGDFTRWAKNGRSAVMAAMSAFPVANFLAFLVGAIIVGSGAIEDPATNGGNFLPLVANGQGWILSVLAFLFIFVNLGSVCTHSLYNGAVGWSHILGSRMRLITVILGVIGTIAALAGVWSHFLDWLNLLGVFVPSIGAVIAVDQLFLRRSAPAPGASPVRWTAFAAWIAGAAAAGVVHYLAPQYVEVLVGMAVAGASYYALTVVTQRSSDRKVVAGVPG